MYPDGDSVTLADLGSGVEHGDSDWKATWSSGGAEHHGSDCPVGVALAPGDAIAWNSNDWGQGSVGGNRDNGCVAKSTCGLHVSSDGLGGGWELCFA